MASINDLMPSDGPALYYDDGFRNTIEDHLPYLQLAANSDVTAVPDATAYKYEYDLYGLLYSLGIPKCYHWVILRVNGFRSPIEYTVAVNNLLIPKSQVIDNIRQTYQINHKVS